MKHMIYNLMFQQAPANKLDQDLGPIIEPDPILFSFDATGWSILFFLMLVLLIILLVKGIKHYNKSAYRRNAIQKIVDLNQNGQQLDLEHQFLEVLIILKITALKAYGRKEVAPLYGKNWLMFLESKGKNTPFGKFESLINSVTYKTGKVEAKELNDLTIISKKWIQTHA